MCYSKSMKKVLLCCLLFGLIGCSANKVAKSDANINSVSITNPWVEYSSLESALAHVSFDVKVPNETDAYYLVMDDSLFEMQYRDISLRKEIGSNDISGDYNEYQDEYDVTISDIVIHCKGEKDKIYCATWYRNEYSYSMTCENGMDLDSLKSIVSSFV